MSAGDSRSARATTRATTTRPTVVHMRADAARLRTPWSRAASSLRTCRCSPRRIRVDGRRTSGTAPRRRPSVRRPHGDPSHLRKNPLHHDGHLRNRNARHQRAGTRRRRRVRRRPSCRPRCPSSSRPYPRPRSPSDGLSDIRSRIRRPLDPHLRVRATRLRRCSRRPRRPTAVAALRSRRSQSHLPHGSHPRHRLPVTAIRPHRDNPHLHRSRTRTTVRLLHLPSPSRHLRTITATTACSKPHPSSAWASHRSSTSD